MSMRSHLGLCIDVDEQVSYVLLQQASHSYHCVRQGMVAGLSTLFSQTFKTDLWPNRRGRLRRLYVSVCLQAAAIRSHFLRMDLSGFTQMSVWWQHETIAVAMADVLPGDLEHVYWDWQVDLEQGGVQVFYTDKAHLQVLHTHKSYLRLQTLSYMESAQHAYQQAVVDQRITTRQAASLGSKPYQAACGAVMLERARYDA